MEDTLVLPVWRFPVRALVLALMAVVGAAVLMNAHREVNEQRAFKQAAAEVEVVAPASVPDISQENIDLALVMFGIEVPSSAEHPRLDRDLHDRGLTSRGAFMEKAKVTVGPAAFTSWGLLGSTLAHEIEVHCQQNFFAIYVMDVIGMDGTGAAERQAYVHELRNAHRFGLAVEDAQMIADTMEYYYPDSATGAATVVPKSVRSWLARNLLRDTRPF